ncbi:D-alanyl-D-alanine carboxypeptidase/D-alanyl-D-alanine-endopeptidase (penicillin-binding protein 4) [Murinocardiopsis flavida]|uniref:D-alanyl-D-alanine carboxypeptidase/D-alanyl-D-alanine-endopeptidase (Penicillin-binding protein 4) n=1 Tax=Murinocardiopsis flavida TaxID=645275 RepID=A0A2P8CW62_9ACTN|nr:D-alanyl-D-alanine carboxypeptidase/D-alanyl-D-alanine-endopeptidase [Murinocardiopsis flavida]PSK89169.1 D-alanyl-D-alanine carboxypeptidase/D-alanyl-D-alanine-endopeptidase (penicillin-binding protein 4) [Murinocardiopsis flavida]
MPATPAPPAAGPRRVRSTGLIAVVAAAALIGPLSGAASAESTADSVAALRKDIDALLDAPELKGAVSGVQVRSLDEDALLYERDAAKPLVPASNAKLLTSAAALDVLGPDHTFATKVAASEDPADGVVDGDLFLKGTGDPTMTAGAYDALAEKVAKSGVTKVTGDLKADDSWFDGKGLAADWDESDEPYHYAAQISALTVAANTDYDTGSVNAKAVPGASKGAAVKASLSPMADNLTVQNKGETGAKDSEASLGAARKSGTNTFTFSGSLPAGGAAFEELRTVHKPTNHATHLFAAALEEHGVEVGGTIARGVAPKGADTVAARESMPLEKLLVPFLKLSNNGHAEILVKSMGRKVEGEGSWDAGLPQISAALNRLGVKTDGMELTDGSGLAATDKVRADTVTALLEEAPGEPWFAAWQKSLPLAGDPDRMVGGTLSERMRGTAAEGKVHAKTGSLTGASALSGYATSADGEKLVFSILNNKYEGAPPRGTQDAIAVRLSEFSREAPKVTPRVSPQRKADEGYTGDLECTWAGTC